MRLTTDSSTRRTVVRLAEPELRVFCKSAVNRDLQQNPDYRCRVEAAQGRLTLSGFDVRL